MKHRSAMGKMVDMNALRAKNEKVRAVGNMNVNARGDTIDSNDNVIQDNTKRVNQHFMRTVAKQQTRPQAPPPPPPLPVVRAEADDRYRPSDDLDDDVPNPDKK
jgi:hypothetical protein